MLYSRWKQVFQRYKQVACLFFEIAHKHTAGGSKLPHKTYFRGVTFTIPKYLSPKAAFLRFFQLVIHRAFLSAVASDIRAHRGTSVKLVCIFTCFAFWA